MQVRKQQLELDMEQQTGSKQEKEYVKYMRVLNRRSKILSPCLFNFYAEYIMRNAGLEETSWNQDCWEKSQHHRYADDTTLMAESEEELKSLLMKVKEESEKVGLIKAQHSENEDHGTWSHHFMGNRWRNSGNSVRLSFWGLQNHCRW